ncbi:MAG TPA: hypothetical protein V6D48_18020, partial [Oculatellaceae cyanobacterium]
GEPPSESETGAYLEFIKVLKDEGLPLKGVLLYGIARPSFQPEAPQLSPVSESWLTAFGEKINALGLTVRLNP